MQGKLNSMNISEERIDNIVIGSGAAGLSAALRIDKNGQNVCLITENIQSGTSRNTGSDKQTYYKLSLAGGNADSVMSMAEDLFSGGAVDGDIALCEAALSARCFYNLVELGVPFPDNEYGEFMGYKTDHDEKSRATSAGPYTSKKMTECLEQAVRDRDILIMDHMQAIKLLVYNKKIYGVLCLDTKCKDEAEYKIIWCDNVILATGGPAGMYHDSVYPTSQIGSSGMAFRAGVKGKNLTEWQFGMASLRPRWNVSGTYMQALPTFISTDADGNDEKEFLLDYFQNTESMLSKIFLKGYQWPFDVNKINGGSSVIDLMIFLETIIKGRRVYLDFRKNTGGKPIDFEKLDKEAYEYLRNADALLDTPYDRLEKMNEPAISFYLDHDIDLQHEMLEIAICAQHNNGGLSTDAWWETEIQGLFAIGEVNGSHGVTRPGGTALNAGQVGAVRASEKIKLDSLKAKRDLSNSNKRIALETAITDSTSTQSKDDNTVTFKNIESLLREEAKEFTIKPTLSKGNRDINEIWLHVSHRMSKVAGMIRDVSKLAQALDEIKNELDYFDSLVKTPETSQLSLYYRLYDMLTEQFMYMSAMRDYALSDAGSRGSALYTDSHGFKWEDWMPEMFRCCLDLRKHNDIIQEVYLTIDDKGKHNIGECLRPVRPVPQIDNFFEVQWKKYRERSNITS